MAQRVWDVVDEKSISLTGVYEWISKGLKDLQKVEDEYIEARRELQDRMYPSHFKALLSDQRKSKKRRRVAGLESSGHVLLVATAGGVLSDDYDVAEAEAEEITAEEATSQGKVPIVPAPVYRSLVTMRTNLKDKWLSGEKRVMITARGATGGGPNLLRSPSSASRIDKREKGRGKDPASPSSPIEASSCELFKQLTVKGMIQLWPDKAAFAEYGSRKFLGEFLMKYIPEFRGMWVAFRKIRKEERGGYIHDSDPNGAIVFHAILEALVFKPNLGSQLVVEVVTVAGSRIKVSAFGSIVGFIPTCYWPEGHFFDPITGTLTFPPDFGKSVVEYQRKPRRTEPEGNDAALKLAPPGGRVVKMGDELRVQTMAFKPSKTRLDWFVVNFAPLAFFSDND